MTDKSIKEVIKNVINDIVGTTAWALFNALTYWSTHGDVRPGSEATRPTTVLRREEQVRRTLNTPAFRELITA